MYLLWQVAAEPAFIQTYTPKSGNVFASIDREKTQDFRTVVNAYENHEHIYQQLERIGGTILIRGRGIVASRIIQKIYETRQLNPKIQIIHLMRSPKAQGSIFGRSQRLVDNHFEFQPFNWPKSCWGGEMRSQLEKASPEQRKNLIDLWGGTTTADRKDWRIIIDEGLREEKYTLLAQLLWEDLMQRLIVF